MNPFAFRSLLPAALLLTGASTLLAHHSANFMVTEDYELPAPGTGRLLATFDWEKFGDTDVLSTEPAATFTLCPRLALSAALRFDDEAGEWNYSSVTPRLHLQLTPPDAAFPVRIGLSAGYQFADDPSAGDHHEEEEHSEEHDEEAGHDHEAHGDDAHEQEHEEAGHAEEHSGHGSHSHGGIHRHGADLWAGRLVIEATLGSTTLVANLIGISPDGESAAWGYAAAVRQQLCHEFAIGVEAIGDFDSHGEHELILGGFWSPLHNLTFRGGVGFGLTDESPDVTVRTGLVWRW